MKDASRSTNEREKSLIVRSRRRWRSADVFEVGVDRPGDLRYALNGVDSVSLQNDLFGLDIRLDLAVVPDPRAVADLDIVVHLDAALDRHTAPDADAFADSDTPVQLGAFANEATGSDLVSGAQLGAFLEDDTVTDDAAESDDDVVADDDVLVQLDEVLDRNVLTEGDAGMDSNTSSNARATGYEKPLAGSAVLVQLGLVALPRGAHGARLSSLGLKG